MDIEIDLDLEDKKSLKEIFKDIDQVGEFESLRIIKSNEDMDFEKNIDDNWSIVLTASDEDYDDFEIFRDDKEYTKEEIKEIIRKFYHSGDWKKLCTLKKDKPYNEELETKWEDIEHGGLNSPNDLEHFKDSMSKALKLIRQNEYLKKNESYVYLRAGEVFMAYEDYESALNFFNKYIALAEKFGEKVRKQTQEDIIECKKIKNKKY